MTEPFDGTSRKLRHPARRRTLLTLVAVTVALLTTPWPAPVGARQACGTNFKLIGVGTTAFPSVDCDAAKTKAGRAALQDLQSKRAAYVCPAACPTLIEVIAPQVNCNDCEPFGEMWLGSAEAEANYRCV